MKTAKYEHCPNCHGINVHNIVTIEDGEPVRVFVECMDCKHYVSLYILRRYTSDESYEGLLNIMRTQIANDQRGRANEIAYYNDNVKKMFKEAADLAHSGKEKRRVEQIIQETDTKDGN